MKSTKSIVFAVLAVATIAASASADDAKLYSGAQCSFADNPLASHHKIHHRLVNTSGADQWVTCPVVRDLAEGIVTYADLETSTAPSSNMRFEERHRATGTVLGWATDDYESNGNGTHRVQFGVDADLGTSDWSSYSLELMVANNSSVNNYRVDEN